MSLKFSEFKKHIRESNLKPAYLLCGDDAYLVRSAAGMLAALAEIKDLNYSRFDDTAAASQVIEAYNQLPLMSKFRVIECAFDNKSPTEVDKIIKHVKKNPNAASVLFFKAQSAPNYLAANGDALETVDCNRLSESLLLSYIASRSQQRGVAVTTAAAKLLILSCNFYMSRIETEFDKLCDTAIDGSIDETLVKELVNADADFKIYELSDALAKKNTALTFKVYEKISEENAPITILGALYSHFRRLLYCAITTDKENLYRYLKVKPYAVEMSVKQAKLFSPVKLKSICDTLSSLDFDIKSGRINDKIALDAFLSKVLCG